METKSPTRPDPEHRERRSLLRDLKYAVIAVATAVSLLSSLGVYLYFLERSERESRGHLAEYTQFLAESLRLPLWNMEYELVGTLCGAFAGRENIARLTVIDDRREVVCEKRSAAAADPRLQRTVSVNHHGRDVGEVRIELDPAYYHQKNRDLLMYNLAATALVLTAVVMLLHFLGGRLLKRPLHSLVERIERFGAGATPLSVPPEESREFASILHRFNDIATRVQAREQSLTQLNGQLAREINDRMQFEERLKQKTAEIDNFFKLAIDLLCIANTEGRFLRLNPAWESTLGYPLDELAGRRFLDFIHPDDLPDTLEAVSRLSEQREVVDFVNRYRARDGSYRWIEWRSAPAGPLIYAAARDITERKAVELQQRRNIERIKALLALTETAGALPERDFLAAALAEAARLTDSSVAFLLRVGDEGAQVEPLAWIPASEEPSEAERERAYLASAAICTESLQRRAPAVADAGEAPPAPPGTAPGQLALRRFITIPVIENGKVRALLGVGNKLEQYDDDDVSTTQLMGNDLWRIAQRKRAEESLRQLNLTLAQRIEEEVSKNREKDHILIQQSRLAAMGEMVHNIAHQWRQPLNALAILLANVQDDFDFKTVTAESLEKTLGQAHALLQQMSTTIDDFRDFFRPDREPAAFDLAHAVEEALFVMAASLRNNNIEVVKSLEPGFTGHGHAHQFAQAVLNVLANAKEAMQARRVAAGRIEIGLARAGDKAVLTIRDNAGGIGEDVLPKIFDPYFTTKEQGSGIGLYMTKMIIERNLRGTITAENSGGGAQFTLTIPCAAKDNAHD